MTSTQALLTKIAALRQRLVQADTTNAATGFTASSPCVNPLQTLEQKVAAGFWHTALLDAAVHHAAPLEESTLPTHLTARAARLLQRGRDLLREFRRLTEEPALQNPQADPLAAFNHETAAMLDCVLRIVQSFPQAATAQMRLCDGLEAILGVIAERLSILISGVAERKRTESQIQLLGEMLIRLARNQPVRIQDSYPLAEAILDSAMQGAPLRFHHVQPDDPVRFVACHSLVTAQVMARLVIHDVDWSSRPQDPILAALLHDVGMLRVPAEVLAHPGPLTDAQRRLIEYHAAVGADILARSVPSKSWLLEAASAHHERMDGTGYPGGLRESQLSPLVRLLAVCDVYAALACPRPHRPALEPRAALTDTLLLAERGELDRFQAESLLDLSFYPVGSVVELADGSVAVVVATHPARNDLRSPARPVLAMVMDARGQPLPYPMQIDLARSESHSILRVLPRPERKELLQSRYPELV
jgi:HD-GYP domain-containing protein (c-di-GMP phosphodiesterase class II)